MQLITGLPCHRGFLGRMGWPLLGALACALAGCVTSPSPPNAKTVGADVTPMKEGKAALAAGNFDLAADKYSLVIAWVPALPQAYVQRSRAWLGKDMPDRALADLDRALKLDPDNADAYFYRARTLNWQRDWSQAIASLDRGIALVPDDAEFYNARGFAKLKLGDETGALSDFEQALRINPDSAWAYRNKGKLLEERFEVGAALMHRSQSERLGAEDDDGFQIGRLQFYLHDFRASAARMLHAADLKPRYAYGVIWWYLAAANASSADAVAPELNRRADSLDNRDWPAAVIDLYRGRIGLEALHAAAQAGDPKSLGDRLCEADFYGAEWLLLRGRPAEARPGFIRAEQNCPKDFYERQGAHAELHWLGSATARD